MPHFFPTGRTSTLPGRPAPGSAAVALRVSATRDGAGRPRCLSTLPARGWHAEALDAADLGRGPCWRSWRR
jgi:hypothetical protein